MATTPGQKFVRRQNSSRGTTSNTTAADITYDTAVISEGGYSFSSPEVTVDEAGLYLNIFDLGQVDLASTRAVGTLVPSINTTNQNSFRATHRYLRSSGGSQQSASIGMAILDLAASDDVKVRNPGVLVPTDALLDYATNASFGGALQLIRLPATNFTYVERTVDAAEVGQSDINTTRPWLDSSGTWTTITYNNEVRDDDGLYPGSGGDLTLKANTKYMIVWGVTVYSSDPSRHTNVVRLQINSNNVQSGTGYHRNAGSQGPPMCGMYLHETGGSTETLRMQATHEIEGGDAGTPNVSDAYLQVIELPSSAEWIHVDNGATDSLTTALAGVTTWYDTPLSSTLRADGNSDLSLDGGNNAVQNDSGGVLSILAIGWHRWDRDSIASASRKNPWTRWDNGGASVGYGVAGSFSRGQQSSDDTWQAHHCSVAAMDLANGADLSFQVQDEASTANSDMGIYASTSRYFLGVQVLNLATLAVASESITADSDAYSITGTTTPLSASFNAVAESDAYLITGTQIPLSTSFNIQPDSESYSIAGTATPLNTSFRMSAESSSYSMDGTDTPLVSGFKATADAGIYLISGTETPLIASFNITSLSDSYQITGTDITITEPESIEAEEGSYVITGTENALTASFSLVAEAGSYSVSGTEINLVAAFNIVSQTSSYLVTGTFVNLNLSVLMPVDNGTYLITGTDAGFRFGSSIIAQTGSDSITGTNLNLSISAKVTAETKSYIIAGTNVEFSNVSNLWIPVAPVSTLWADKSDATTAWDNQAEQSTTWDNDSEASTEWTDVPETSTTWNDI